MRHGFLGKGFTDDNSTSNNNNNRYLMIKTSGKKIAQLDIPKTDVKRNVSSPQNTSSRRRLLLHFSHSGVAPFARTRVHCTPNAPRRCHPLCFRMGELELHTHKCRLKTNNPVFTPTGKENDNGRYVALRGRESIRTKNHNRCEKKIRLNAMDPVFARERKNG